MLVAAEVPDGARIVDTYAPVDLADCLQLSALGFSGIVRYIDNLTLREVEWIASANLGLMLIRTCRKAGWLPTPLIGEADGQSIAKAAASLGLPKGVSAWIDDEGAGGAASDEIAYLNAAYNALGSFCLPGIYVGAGSHLSSSELYHRLRMTRYWKSGSLTPSVAVRGFCMHQEPPLDRVLPGLPSHLFDVSTASADLLGGRVCWAISA